MKSYTDLEQSKKLAEILPIESTDMFYTLIDQGLYLEVKQGIEPSKDDVPCWSLAALLNVLPSGKVLIHDKGSYGYKCICKNIDSYLYDNPVDACVKMIVKLHEHKLL